MTKKESWVMERRHKYRTATGADAHKRPPAGSRESCFVSPYTKRDGTHVKGHMRAINR